MDGQTIEKDLTTQGFSILTKHDVDLSTLEIFVREWRNLYLSTEKYKFVEDETIPIGYVDRYRENEKTPSEHFYYVPTHFQLPKLLEELTEYFYFQLSIEAESIYNLFVRKNIIKNFKNSAFLLDIIYYQPFHAKPEKKYIDKNCYIRAGAHFDKNLMTILLPPIEPGLQFRINDQWIDPEIPRDSLLLIGGEKLNTLSNGMLEKAYHRVVSPIEKTLQDRLAFAFFVDKNDSS